MTELDKLKDLVASPPDPKLSAVTSAILDTIMLEIPLPANGLAVASAVYCTLLNRIMRDCLRPTEVEDIEEAVLCAAEQVRELISELILEAPKLSKLSKERK